MQTTLHHIDNTAAKKTRLARLSQLHRSFRHWGGPCQLLREKVVRNFGACTRHPIELQPPTSTHPKRRGQRRGVARSRGLLSTKGPTKAPGRTNPPSAGSMRGASPSNRSRGLGPFHSEPPSATNGCAGRPRQIPEAPIAQPSSSANT